MEKTLDRQVQFWAVLGPFILCMTILVSFMNPSFAQKILAAAGIAGIPVCWRFRLKGLAGSALFLTALFAYFSWSMSVEQLLWNGGLALSTALAFAVTALSLDEVEALIGNLEVQSKSRLDHLWTLDERLKDLQEESKMHQAELSERLLRAEADAAAYKERLEVSEKLVQAIREELVISHDRQQKFLEELQKAREEIPVADPFSEELSTLTSEIEKLKEENLALKEAKKARPAKSSASADVRALQQKLKQQQKKLDENEENLNEARAALFRMQEKLFAKQREWVEERKQLEEQLVER